MVEKFHSKTKVHRENQEAIQAEDEMVAVKEKIVKNEIDLWTKTKNVSISARRNGTKGRNTNKKSIITSETQEQSRRKTRKKKADGTNLEGEVEKYTSWLRTQRKTEISQREAENDRKNAKGRQRSVEDWSLSIGKREREIRRNEGRIAALDLESSG